MRPLLFAVGLLFSLPVFAGDDPAKLLADLSSDDPQTRDKAERALWNASGDAYEICRRTLEATTDPEVESRLRPIVLWLRLESRLPAILAANRERWFLSRKDGKVTHTWCQSATLETVDGQRVWILKTAMHTETAGGLTTFTANTRLRHGRVLTPVASTVEVLNAEGRHVLYNRFQKNGVFTRISPAPDFNLPPPASDDSGDPPQLPVEALILFMDLAGVQEAPTVSWRPVMHLMPWAIVDAVARRRRSRRHAPGAVFTASRGEEETVNVAGRQVKAWKYAVAEWPVEFLVSPTEGVVRMRGGGSETEVSTREACAAAGLDPEARREARRKDLVKALDDGARREEAELALTKVPEALELCRERLAAGADGETKASLERLTRWLDPEFGRAEMEAIWRERCFLERSKLGDVQGAAWQTAKEEAGPEGHAWSWGFEARRHGKSSLAVSWRGRTRADAWLAPIDARMDLRKSDRVVRSWWKLSEEFLVLNEEGDRRDEDDSLALRDPATGVALVPDLLLGAVVERAALAGLRGFEVRILLTVYGPTTAPVTVKRVGEETLEWNGQSVVVVRYQTTNAPFGGAAWLIDPGRGILRMTYAGKTLDRSTPEALTAAGLTRSGTDEDDVHRLLVLVKDGTAEEREDATARLLHSGTAAPDVAAEAAVATDPAYRERLQAIACWLDPEFGRERLASIGRARRFIKERNAVVSTTTVMTARPSAAGAGWDLELRGGVLPMLDDTPISVHSSSDLASRRLTLRLTEGDRTYDIDADVRRTGCYFSVQKLDALGELEDDDSGDWQGFSGDTRWHPTLGPTLWFFVERASLARLESFEVCQWVLAEEKVVRMNFRFGGEEDVEVAGGAKVKARKYVGGAGADAHTYFVSDARGIVKGRMGADDLKVEEVPEDRK